MKHALHALLNALVFHAGPPGSTGFHQRAEARSAYERGDYATALRLLEPLAGGGNAEAQNLLGILYDNGQGVPRDAAEAVTWYRRAAEQGHASAQCSVGRRYHLGEGVQQKHFEATKWYRLSAEQGNPDAQHGLGYLSSQGLGVPQDMTEALGGSGLPPTRGTPQRGRRSAIFMPPAALLLSSATSRRPSFQRPRRTHGGLMNNPQRSFTGPLSPVRIRWRQRNGYNQSGSGRRKMIGPRYSTGWPGLVNT